MARTVLIHFTGKEGEFDAAIEKIIESNDRLTRQANAGLNAIMDASMALSADTIRESLPSLSQKERQELYRLLHDGFGCRMF